MSDDQIWLCHVTQDVNIEIFYCVVILPINNGNSHKISSEKALYFRVISQKPHGGRWKTTSPVPLGLKNHNFLSSKDK